MVDSATDTPTPMPVGSGRTSSNRYPRLSPAAAPAPRSRQHSRRPHGFHVPSPGRSTSHAPGLDLLTLSVPGDATNGVTIDASATGEPDRSCTVTDHPFLSFPARSLSEPNAVSQLRPPLPISAGIDLNPEVAVAAAGELAGEHGLLHAPLHLEHLRAALRLAVELEHEPRVGLGAHRDVELRVRRRHRRGLAPALPDADPAAVVHHRLRRGALEVERDDHLPEQPPGAAADAARGAPPASVHHDLQPRRARPEQRRLRGEAVEVGLGEVERGGERARRRRWRRRRRCLRRGRQQQRRVGGLVRQLVEADLAVARRGGWVHPGPGSGGARRHRHLQREVADQHPHERARVH
ncbi:Os07g0133601, partial [Oryza sativa Japonica Group]